MSLPFQPLNVGDINDDDAQVIDSLVQPQADPPKPLPDVMVSEVVKRPTPITRLQAGTQQIQSGWQAVMLLPGDEFRQSLVVAIASADPTDYVRIASESNAATSGRVYQANPITLAKHTGAVWVFNPTANAVDVSWFAVTK